MYSAFRNIFDRLAAILGLVLVSPILLVAMLLIKRDAGPALFTQDRLGKDAQPFKVIKLRTMVINADAMLDESGNATGNRITKVGQFLRKSSIDELPQLINIVKGDMALIGPRPILPRMLPFMSEREHERFLARPGVTGLAQVKGRNFLRWSRRFHYDIIYVDHQSLRLDLFILWRTIVIVLRQDGIAADRNPGLVDDITIRPLDTDLSE